MSIEYRVYAYISGAWTQLLDTIPATLHWGLPDGEQARISDIDEMTVTLNNNDGRYSPNGASPLAGWDEGVKVKLVASSAGQSRVKFMGRISSIELERGPGDVKVKITVLGWMDNATRYDVITPPLLEDVTIDEGIDDILADIPVQPSAQDINTGSFVFDRLFDDVGEKTKGYTEFAKFVNSEMGAAYVRHDGHNGETFVVEGLETRNGTRGLAQYSSVDDNRVTTTGDFRVTTTGDFRVTVERQNVATFDENVIANKDVRHGKDVVNYFSVSAYPKKIDDVPTLIYESEEPIYIPAGATKTLRVFWTDSDGRRKINAVPPTGDGKTVVLLHYEFENYADGGLDAGGGGAVGGHWVDEIGHVGIDHDAPYINFSKFGDGSVAYDGSLAWFELTYSPNFNLGTADFWMETWDYRYGGTIGQAAVSRNGAVGFPPFLFGSSNGTSYTFCASSSGASFDIANNVTMGTIAVNNWNYIAAGRQNGTLYTFLNGTLINSVAASGAFFAGTTNLYFGRNAGTYLAGNGDDFFMMKGECLHTSSFTAPTSPRDLSEGAYFKFNTASDFSGTDIEDYLTRSIEYGTEGAIFTLTNSYTAGGYANIKVYGYGIYSNSSVEDSVSDDTSITARGQKSINLSMPYQVTTDFGLLEANRVVELEKNPRTVLHGITYPATRSQALTDTFLYLDIGDLIPVQHTSDGIDAWYYINGIDAELQNSKVAWVSYTLKQAFTLAKGLTHVAVEFAGGAATDAIKYAYNPIISADSVTSRALSAWIWLDAVTNSNDQIIVGTKGNTPGISLYIDNHATNVLLSFDSSRFATGGKWSCPANPFAVGGWVHVLVAYDHSSTTNDPTIYVNGTSQTITENTAPSGAAASEEGAPFVIGNNSAGTAGFNGKIKDVREYNMTQTGRTAQELATGISGEGAEGTGFYEGMKFCAFTVRTDEEAGFTDLTLTDEKLIEGYLGYVGTPQGSPIVRLT